MKNKLNKINKYAINERKRKVCEYINDKIYKLISKVLL